MGARWRHLAGGLSALETGHSSATNAQQVDQVNELLNASYRERPTDLLVDGEGHRYGERGEPDGGDDE